MRLRIYTTVEVLHLHKIRLRLGSLHLKCQVVVTGFAIVDVRLERLFALGIGIVNAW